MKTVFNVQNTLNLCHKVSEISTKEVLCLKPLCKDKGAGTGGERSQPELDSKWKQGRLTKKYQRKIVFIKMIKARLCMLCDKHGRVSD